MQVDELARTPQTTASVLADERLLPRRFLVVSNRLPYRLSVQDDRVIFERKWKADEAGELRRIEVEIDDREVEVHGMDSVREILYAALEEKGIHPDSMVRIEKTRNVMKATTVFRVTFKG